MAFSLFFFFSCYGDHRDLHVLTHSFPTRRSSDLKFGIDDGLPGAAAGAKIPINVHADEFNELMGDEFIPMVNKGGGAGVQVTAYTQTLSDIEARIGNRAKAGQEIGRAHV